MDGCERRGFFCGRSSFDTRCSAGGTVWADSGGRHRTDDRLRFDAIADSALLEDGAPLTIRVGYDANARTITVSDNGVGMSRQEVIDHIGTIAKSGTREFFHRLSADAAKQACSALKAKHMTCMVIAP